MFKSGFIHLYCVLAPYLLGFQSMIQRYFIPDSPLYHLKRGTRVLQSVMCWPFKICEALLHMVQDTLQVHPVRILSP